MKKLKIKGFTLIELIVVIAIIGIIMLGLANYFKPIRQVFVDSSNYEQYRTVQSGIGRYIAENTRYATSLAIFKKGNSVTSDGSTVSITSEDQAIDAFLLKNNINKNKTGITAAETAAIQDYKETIRVITIETDTVYSVNNRDCAGRVHMYRWNENLSPTAGFDQYMALGPAYYGQASYAIQLTPDLSNGSALKIDVTSYTDGDAKKITVTTNTSVLYANLSSPINGLYCVDGLKNASGTGYIPTTDPGDRFYIVYANSTYKYTV